MEPADSVEISFVLPCLNEAATIEACVRDCIRALRLSRVSGEVLVADNGSDDGSQELARRVGARVVEIPEKGYGSALLGGIRAARGKYVLMADSDMSYDFSEMPRFLELLRQGNELVMGCRLPKGGGVIYPGAMPWSHRWIGNPLLSGLGRLFFNAPTIDFHCGIRAFDKAKMLSLNLTTAGMEFASEMIVKSNFANLRMAQVPVTLRPDGRARPPHLRTWRDGWRHLRFMLLYCPRWLFFYPGIFLLALCAAAFLFLLPAPRSVAEIVFDTNTLLVAGTGVIMGFQIVLLAIVMEVFARSAGLLPRNKLVDRISGGSPFETGLLTGGAIGLVGLGYLLYAVNVWKGTGFGDLSYPESLRLIIPAIIAMCIGLQTIFGGFVLAVLGLRNGTVQEKTAEATI